MVLDEVSSVNEEIIVSNYRVPCEERRHIWDTHIVRTNKDGLTLVTEMKECVNCKIIRDIDVSPY